jgi:hypothetical protein
MRLQSWGSAILSLGRAGGRHTEIALTDEAGSNAQWAEQIAGLRVQEADPLQLARIELALGNQPVTDGHAVLAFIRKIRRLRRVLGGNGGFTDSAIRLWSRVAKLRESSHYPGRLHDESWKKLGPLSGPWAQDGAPQ